MVNVQKCVLWRPQATKCLKYAGGHFVFIKYDEKNTLKPQKHRIVRLAAGRGENSLVFYGFLYSSIWLNLVKF